MRGDGQAVSLERIRPDVNIDAQACSNLMCAIIDQAVSEARAGLGGRELANYLFAPGGGLASHALLVLDIDLSPKATREQLRREGVTPEWLAAKEDERIEAERKRRRIRDARAAMRLCARCGGIGLQVGADGCWGLCARCTLGLPAEMLARLNLGAWCAGRVPEAKPDEKAGRTGTSRSQNGTVARVRRRRAR